MSLRPAAFFDMDHTLLRVNSGARWVSFMRRRGEVGAGMLLRSIVWTAQYKLAILDMETLATRLISDMTGDSEAEMRDKCAFFFEQELIPTIAPSAPGILEQHRAEGHEIVMLTSSTQYIAEPLATHLGIEHVLCTRLHVQDGCFVGTCERPTCYGTGKVLHAERFAAKNDIDLSQSYFYTDSFSDLPMLERVGEPRIVNPDRRLRSHARRRGWPIQNW